MKAEELMIGDWVYGLDKAGGKHPSCIFAVDIYPNNKTPRIVTYGGYGYQVEDLEPIPLTREILEKNGWSLWEIEGEYKHQKSSVIALYGRKLPFSVFDGIEINYVHELQHALRLCGINLEIKL